MEEIAYRKRKYPLCERTRLSHVLTPMVKNADDFGLKGTKSTMLARDPQPLTLLHLHGRAGIFRHDLALQNSHLASFQHTPAKHSDCSLMKRKCQQLSEIAHI